MLKPQNRIDPVIKWSGSKRRVAPTIGKLIPLSNRFIEPFVGGGAMLPFRGVEKAIASDIIPELVELWIMIRDSPSELASRYEELWTKLQSNWEYYYVVRERFNSDRNPIDFLFLTRTCVNGLIRYNAKREFNNSLHVTRPGINPATLRQIIFQWSYFVKNVDFRIADYRETLKEADSNDIIFLDPPYGGTKGRYTQVEFNLIDFYSELERLNNLGAKWVLTFDGMAGDRNYSFPVPNDLYKHKIFLNTGNSPFTKMMRTTVDAVFESVYLNFEPSSELRCDLREKIDQKPTLFGNLDM